LWPIGAVQTATGYDVAWKIPGANEYTAWNIRQQRQLHLEYHWRRAGNSTALEALGDTFHQDLVMAMATIGAPRRATFSLQVQGL